MSGDWEKHWEGGFPTVEVIKATTPPRQRHPLSTLSKQAPRVSPQWSIPFEDTR